jgi:hypothetical protein
MNENMKTYKLSHSTDSKSGIFNTEIEILTRKG